MVVGESLPVSLGSHFGFVFTVLSRLPFWGAIQCSLVVGAASSWFVAVSLSNFRTKTLNLNIDYLNFAIRWYLFLKLPVPFSEATGAFF